MACVEIARGTSTTNNATCTATYGGALGTISAGHIVVAAIVNDDTQATATCDDDAGATNSYSRDDSHNNGVANSVVVFSCAIADAIDSGTVFTVTWPASATRKAVIVYHADDLDDTGGRVVENGRGTGTSQAPSATLDASISVADTLTFGAGCVTSDGALAWTPDGTDGDVVDVTNRSLVTSFRDRTATGTHTESGSFSDTSSAWSMVVVAYRRTSGATELTPASITRTRAFGTPTSSPSVLPASIARTRALGSPTVSTGATPVSPASIVVTRSLGSPVANPQVVVASIVRTRAMGAVSLEGEIAATYVASTDLLMLLVMMGKRPGRALD